MAFNSRKFQRLMDEEKTNASQFVDEFEDDFADDFDDEPSEEPAPAAEFESAPITEFEPVAEEEPQQTEEVIAEDTAEEEAADEPAIIAEPVIAEEPVAAEEKPAEEAYDPQMMWQDMASMAIKAKECIRAGAFFRANDIVAAMRSLLVEMMCRANGINENFNENADYLNDDCKKDIYASYAALNEQALSDAVTHIMSVTYKYI